MKLSNILSGVVLLLLSTPGVAAELKVGSRAYPEIEDAIAAVPDIRARLPKGEPITISIPPGVHAITQSIRIDAQHGGTPDNPLIIAGAGAKSTRIIGSASISSRPATRSDAPDLPAGTLAIDLPPGDGSIGLVRRGAFLSVPHAGFMLFQGSARLRPARWPSQGFAAGTLLSPPSGTDATQGLLLKTSLPAKPEPDNRNLWAGGYWSSDWNFELTPISSIGPTGEIRLSPLRSPLAARPNVRLYVENTINGLRPGTFVVLPERRLALFLPTPSSAGPKVEIAVTRELLVLSGAHNVTITGIAFDRALGAAVRAENSSDVELSGIAVRQTGGHGIVVTGGRNVAIRDSVISQTGERGVVLIGGDRAKLSPGGHSFINGVISDFGQDSPSYRGGVQLAGVGNSVTGSLITGGDHLAVQIGGNDNLVSGNEISDVLRDTEDAGAIYMGADWSERGNTISGNYIHDLGTPGKKTVFLSGIYLDDQASGTIASGNVVIGGDFGIVIGGGKDNLVSDNLLTAFTRGAIYADSRGVTGHAGAFNRKLAEKFNAMPTTSAAWRKRYPNLARERIVDRATPDNNVIRGNWMQGKKFVYADPSTMPLLKVEDSHAIRLDDVRPGALAAELKRAGNRTILAQRRAALAKLLPLQRIPD